MATRTILPLDLVLAESPAAVGPKHNTAPCCLACLRPATPDFSCPSCNFPMCSEQCSSAVQHAEQECSVFPRMPGLQDLSLPAPQYMCIAPLRLLLTKETQPEVLLLLLSFRLLLLLRFPFLLILLLILLRCGDTSCSTETTVPTGRSTTRSPLPGNRRWRSC